MGKLYDNLQKQLKTEYKKEAEDCIEIYENLRKISNGSVWESDWRCLTTIAGWIGPKPNTIAYKPSKVGYIFLKGIS